MRLKTRGVRLNSETKTWDYNWHGNNFGRFDAAGAYAGALLTAREAQPPIYT